MPQKVAGVEVTLSANSGKLLTELERSRKEILKLRKTVDRSANRIKYAFNKIRRAAQVVASAFIFVAGVRQLGNLVSAMAKAEDSVKLMQARFQQFAREGDAFTKIYQQSLELGVSLDETANGMTRLLVATKELGTTQSVLQDVQKNIVILGRAGGTSAEEMKGAMRQLSQGLASGRLQGEELRSVLENLPLVAMEIADQMGIAMGQIREAAAEGQITGDVVVDALAEIEIGMEDLPQTWAMQTQNLRTEWDLFLNDLSNAVDEAGLLKDLTDAVRWVRVNMLGSFVGTPTDDLKSQLDDAEKRLQEFEYKRAIALAKSVFSPIPESRGPRSQEAMGAFSSGAGANAYILEIELQKKAIADLNEELERRARLEEMAKKTAEARTALTQDKTDQDRLEQLNKDAQKIRDEMKTDIDKFFEMVGRMDELVDSGALSALDASAYVAQAYREMMDAAEAATKEANDQLEKMAADSEGAFEQMDEFAKQAARNMQDAFAEFLFSPFEDGLKQMLKSFLDVIRRMLANQLAAQIFASTGLGSLFGGPKAMGGPVTAGTPYLVGEKGPELWIPRQSGNIVPAGGFGGASITYNIDARGVDEAAVVSRMVPLLERTVQITKDEVRRDINEGRF